MGIPVQIKFSILLFVGLLTGCIRNSTPGLEKTKFTKLDSLTDSYLVIQDSMMNTWKMIMMHEAEKVESMHMLVSIMQWAGDDQNRESLHVRLEQLNKIKVTPKTLSNPYVVKEFDAANEALVLELLQKAENTPDYVHNQEMQSLVDKIKTHGKLVKGLRYTYDSIAVHFNKFVELNKTMIGEIDNPQNLEKKNLFYEVSESK